jgi:putative spermidine/putrescine transport system substrate-binding protein
MGRAQARSGAFTTTVFGGAYEDQYVKHIVKPFEEKTGNKVVMKLGLSGAWVTNAIINRAAPEIDLLLLPYPDNIRATMENIGMPLTVQDIPNIAKVDPIWYDQFDHQAIGLDYVGYGIAYRHDLVPKPLKSWKDVWDPALKGKVIIPQIGNWGSWEMLVVASRIHGGSVDNLDPGFKALGKLRPNIRQFFKSSADISNLLGSGEAWVCAMATNIAPYALIDAGKPVTFVFPTEGAPVGAVSYHIAKNSKNADLCKSFVDFALSTSVQENFCNGMVAAPTNKDAVINQKTRERVPPRSNLILFDWRKIIPQMTKLTDQWNQEVSF